MSSIDQQKTASRLTRRRFLALGAGAVGAWALAACSPQASNPTAVPASTALPKDLSPTVGPAGGVVQVKATTAPSGRRLRIGTSFSVSTLDPFVSHQSLVSYGITQTLFAISPEQKIVPWIAQSMERNGDEGWTVKINPAARFHSGKAIDAKAVLKAIERCMERGAAMASLKGAKYEVVDTHTLRIGTSRPDPWLPTHFVSSRNFPIFDADLISEKPDTSDLTQKDFGCGPFKAVKLTPEVLSLDAVPDAWHGASKLAGVDVRFIVDPQARLAALKTGEIDLMLYPAADSVAQIKATPGLHFKLAMAGPGRTFWYMNHKKPPLDDVNVRKACALGIDRKQIAEQVLNGLYQASDSWYPSYVPWRVANIRTDVAEAKRLLEQSGWTMGSDGIRRKSDQRLSFDYYHYPQQPDSKVIAEAIQAQLKPLGIDLKLKQSDDILSTWRGKTYDSGTTFYDMMEALNPAVRLERTFRTDGSENYGFWGSAELDSVIDKLSTEFDTERQHALLREAQSILDRDVPFTFVVGRIWPSVTNDAFASYEPPIENNYYAVGKDTAPAG